MLGAQVQAPTRPYMCRNSGNSGKRAAGIAGILPARVVVLERYHALRGEQRRVLRSATLQNQAPDR